MRSKILEEAKKTQGKLQPYTRIIESLWRTVKETPYLLAQYPSPKVFERHLDEAPVPDVVDALDSVFPSAVRSAKRKIYVDLALMDTSKVY